MENSDRQAVSFIFDKLFPGRGDKIQSISNERCKQASRLATARAHLSEELEKLEEDIRKVVEGETEDVPAEFALSQLIRIGKAWKAMELISSPCGDLPIVFIMDSLLLKDSHNKLDYCKDGVEEELFLTGLSIHNLRIVTRLVPVETESSPMGVKSVPESGFRKLGDITAWGMPFLGAFHSHPGEGIPEPSGQDLKQFETYRTHGHKALGGIFTHDGYVRFFTHQPEFEVFIFGEGIKEIKDYVYRIEKV